MFERVNNEIWVSVLVPVYNVELYIERCARSLFEQTMKDHIEFIFVDDCSKDNSVSIIEHILTDYPERSDQVKIIHHYENKGLACTRMTGLMESVGKYVIHCDGDDWVEPEMYKRLLNKAMIENADVVLCDFYYEYAKKSILEKQCPSSDPINFVSELLSGKLHNSMWNKLINRELYDKCEYLWIPHIDMWEDVSVISRILNNAKNISYINLPLYHYNQTNIKSYTKNRNNLSANQIWYTYNIVNNYFSSKKIQLSALRMFKQRALLLILLLCDSANRVTWIKRFYGNEVPAIINCSWGIYERILFGCYVRHLFGIADFIRYSTFLFKRIVLF